MKSFIFALVCLLLLNNQGSSQIAGLPYNEKYANSFLGEWYWKSGSDSFKIVLKETRFLDKRIKKYNKIIAGWHSYTVKGNLIESSCEFISDTLNNSTTITAIPQNDTTLQLTVQDLTANRLYGATIKLIPNSGLQAIWTLELKEVVRVNETRTYPNTQTLPSNIVLTKKEQ